MTATCETSRDYSHFDRWCEGGCKTTPAWETFCDHSYFDQWCIRPVGSFIFGKGFHVKTREEAAEICRLLNENAALKADLESQAEQCRLVSRAAVDNDLQRQGLKLDLETMTRERDQLREQCEKQGEMLADAHAERVGLGRLIQPEVNAWAKMCFGTEAFNPQERVHRFLEEALELAQACGATTSEVSMLTSYVYGRPVGEKKQEAAGTLLTLAALCTAHGLDMQRCGEEELGRLNDPAVTDRIRAKHLSKPRNSPLPGTADHIPDANNMVAPNLCTNCTSSEEMGR